MFIPKQNHLYYYDHFNSTTFLETIFVAFKCPKKFQNDIIPIEKKAEHHCMSSQLRNNLSNVTVYAWSSTPHITFLHQGRAAHVLHQV